MTVRVEGLGKRYQRGIDRYGKLFEMLRYRANDYFWALRDVSFEVGSGELFGIIGKNGAGKSTLLRILARITRPNEGRVELHGLVGSLIQIGAGFHPELTGRENTFLNAALLGMSRNHVQRRFDEIVDFSNIAEFLDSPIKRYSSGMRTRLGFAIASHLDQEILLVDEILSFADADFRLKAMRKIDELTREGRTVLFVGHNMSIIHSSCSRALWLDEGSVRAIGDAREVVSSYITRGLGGTDGTSGFVPLPPESEVPDRGHLTLTHVRFLNGEDEQVARLTCGSDAQVAVGYRDLDASPAEASLLLTIRRDQRPVFSSDSAVVHEDFAGRPTSGEFVCRIARLPLMPGTYSLSVECRLGSEVAQRFTDLVNFEVAEGDYHSTGRLPTPGSGYALVDYEWRVRGS